MYLLWWVNSPCSRLWQVRIFDLVTEDNFILTLGDAAATHKISALTFNPRTNHLARTLPAALLAPI